MNPYFYAGKQFRRGKINEFRDTNFHDVRQF
jgi:hypothetical protein